MSAYLPKDIGAGGSGGSVTTNPDDQSTTADSGTGATDTVATTTGTTAPSGTGTGSATTSGTVTPNIGSAFPGLQTAGAALYRKYGLTPATLSINIPTTGTGTFSGIVAFSQTAPNAALVVAQPARIGRVDITVDFANDTLAGKATGFANPAADTTTTGELTLRGSTARNPDSIIAGLTGTLTETTSGVPVQLTVTNQLIGDFTGTNADAIRLSGIGSAVDSGGNGVLEFSVILAD